VAPTVTTDPGAIYWVAMSADGTRLVVLEHGGVLVQHRADGRRTGREVSGIKEVATSTDLAVVATVEGRLEVLDAETLEPTGRPLPGIDSAANQGRMGRAHRRARPYRELCPDGA
jgi:hypothetical protein